MSKNINVNPDHYKVAGRERQGEDIPQDDHKQTYKEARKEEEADKPRSAPPDKTR